jgi:hypothetical protein
MAGCSPIAAVRSIPRFAEAAGHASPFADAGYTEEIATMTAATSLLDFILNLLKDPQVQAEFRASPEHVLAANGLLGVSAADIHETLPLVTDNRFVELNSSHAASPSVVPAAGDSGTHAAVQYLHHITTTYRYDDHGHDLGHMNIWAVGDMTQTFDDSHTVTGSSTSGPVTSDPGGSPGTGAFRHPSHGQGEGLHSFGSGAAMISAGGTGSPAGYIGDTFGSHDSTGFSHADYGGVGSSPGPDDYHTHDVHSSLGDSYYGHDSEHGTYDGQEAHIYLHLH